MLRSTFLAGTAIFMMAGSALADCADEFEDLQKLTGETVISSDLRRDMNKLRSATRTLANYGKEDACETVVEAIEDVIEKRKEARQEKLEREAKLERFGTAAAVSSMKGVVRANDIQGKDIYNTKGTELGVAEAVTIDADQGNIAYVVMSHGGFLGIGEKLLAVPWKKFRITKDRDALVLDVTEETIEKAPGFDDDDWPDMNDPEWRKNIDAFFQQ
jgi:sporulation protein YlmC with PRC-barrel domain